ncbi:MAG: carbamoyl phosphate synthase small subunit [Clostridia bacterium]|nr:carbamoyl phosphate synthase small subunit [Clostridia bacterium]
MEKKKVYLTLENGNVFQGYRFGGAGNVSGELVFSTGMVGYVETLTDPESYGKIVVQTFPLVGNYGVARSDMESKKVWASAFIVREVCDAPSNFRMEEDLETFMKEENVVGVYGVDTRQLTKILREEGAMNARISEKPLTDAELVALKNHKTENALSAVAPTEKTVYTAENANCTVALWNFGAKRSLIENLLKKGCNVISMPACSTAEEVLAQNADGVMIAGGAGDPVDGDAYLEEIKKILGKTAVFGVEFGHLLLARAFGAETKKQKHGHRGSNQPVKCVKCGRVYISSQNHGYAVVGESVKTGFVKFVSLNDGSCEGIDYEEYNAFGVQFDPESCSATGEENPLYKKFFAMMRKEKENA